MLGLNADQLASALGVAGSHAGGLIEFLFEGVFAQPATGAPGSRPGTHLVVFGRDSEGVSMSFHLNGQRHTLLATDYPGSVEQPLDFAAAIDRLGRYAAPLLGEERVLRVADLVNRLDQLEDVSPLAESVTAAGALVP